MYKLIDTDDETTIGTYATEAEAYAATDLFPSDCVDGAETWEEVIEVADQHADGSMGVLGGYRVDRVEDEAVA